VLRLDNLAKSFGGRALFEGASLEARFLEITGGEPREDAAPVLRGLESTFE